MRAELLSLMADQKIARIVAQQDISGSPRMGRVTMILAKNAKQDESD